MNMRLLLVRHGQTAWNAGGRFMGQMDVPLDETGQAQVLAVSRRLADERPAIIYTSGLKRAQQTALAIQSAMNTHPEVKADARLNEMHFGDWQGKTYAELMENDPVALARWESDRLDGAPPNGESFQMLANRVRAAYQAICSEHPDQTVLVAGHGGSLQVLIVLALELPPETFWKMRLSNASLSELQIHQAGATLLLLNDTSHLSSNGAQAAAELG
jgi:alpha-ribazole phosphatase